MQRVLSVFQTVIPGTILAFMAFVVLWKGGKSIDATWLYVGVCGIAILLQWARREGSQRVHLWLWMALWAFVVLSVLSLAFSSTRNYGLDEVLRDAASVLLFLWVARRTSADGQIGRAHV